MRIVSFFFSQNETLKKIIFQHYFTFKVNVSAMNYDSYPFSKERERYKFKLIFDSHHIATFFNSQKFLIENAFLTLL